MRMSLSQLYDKGMRINFKNLQIVDKDSGVDFFQQMFFCSAKPFVFQNT